MPGRQFNNGSYRYGFNGKENDNEVKGTGNQQDYGMRIYDPRLGKFLSIDPLSKSYPWNSPYAFAENSPIENIDLDGMEKHTVHVKNTNGQQQVLMVQTDNSLRYRCISPSGVPIKPQIVQYIMYDEKGRVTVSPEMPLKNFGNTMYVGPWNPKDEKGKDSYKYPAINSLDAAGYKHDRAYTEKFAAGPMDAIGDLNVIDIDKQLVKDALSVVALYTLGQNDPITKQPVTLETAQAAVSVAKIFTAIVVEKSIRIGAKTAAEEFQKQLAISFKKRKRE